MQRSQFLAEPVKSEFTFHCLRCSGRRTHATYGNTFSLAQYDKLFIEVYLIWYWLLDTDQRQILSIQIQNNLHLKNLIQRRMSPLR